jgi:hypothetical protein
MNTTKCKVLGVTAALLLVGAAACTDTVVEPKSTITDANVFTDVNSYKAFLGKIYGGLALSGQQGGAGQPDLDPSFDEGFSQYVRLLWEAEELPTDEAVIGWGDIGLPELNTGLWSSSNPFLVALYYRIYFQVGMANEFLRQTSDTVLAARGNVNDSVKAVIQGYRAEARFLRALSYWHGIDLFGGIPIVTEDDPLGATPPQQSTRAEVYNYVVGELQAIKGDLPQPGPSSYGRATGPAASMLLAKLYLNAGVYTGTDDYADALGAVEDVINSGAYSLDPNYRHIFMADNNTSPEIIFAVPEDGLKTQTWGSTTFLIHAACGNTMSNGDYGIDGCWWGIRLKPEAYNNYAAGDNRAGYFWTANQTVAVTSIGDFAAGIAAPKYTNVTSTGADGSHPTFVDVDFPMFRLGDAYLMYAEAVLRGGGGTRAQALTYVNALRQRAYGGATGNITDPELTLDFILAERGRELLWEAHRRTDLVRYGLFTGGGYIWAWKGGTEAGQATDPCLDTYPLPGSELVTNPNLKQKTGCYGG